MMREIDKTVVTMRERENTYVYFECYKFLLDRSHKEKEVNWFLVQFVKEKFIFSQTVAHSEFVGMVISEMSQNIRLFSLASKTRLLSFLI